MPFILHPHFAKALVHIGERSGQTDAGPTIYNNLGSTYELASFYSTPLYVPLLIVALTVTLVGWLLAYARPRWLGQICAVLLMFVALDLLREPQSSWLVDGGGDSARRLPGTARATAPGTGSSRATSRADSVVWHK
ncbi:hypothetical protein HC891_06625 [Candidatus Gracilibacteria bacterium]|nr:hypothetical protein [Candidatus Gracilibacteria bacterium]